MIHGYSIFSPITGPQTVDLNIDPAIVEKECEDLHGPGLGNPLDQPLGRLPATSSQPKPKPKPKPKAKNSQAHLLHWDTAQMYATLGDAESGDIRPEPPALAASDAHHRDSLGQIEELLGHPCWEPKKQKLDTCLTIQFEAAEKERQRAQVKVEKARAERLAKWDGQDGQPAKRQRT